ncbi:MAG TPA: hypothetical protein VKD08_13365 [Ignavibacteriaceae bacterium]|nr:hypothetical protein [Ignavibacteriaceae bacterium]
MVQILHDNFVWNARRLIIQQVDRGQDPTWIRGDASGEIPTRGKTQDQDYQPDCESYNPTPGSSNPSIKILQAIYIL